MRSGAGKNFGADSGWPQGGGGGRGRTGRTRTAGCTIRPTLTWSGQMAESNDAQVENPSFAAGAGHALDIEAALRDGALTAEQALVEMQKQMEASTAAQIAELKEGLAEQLAKASSVDSVVASAVGRVLSTPTNWHQATVQSACSGSPDAPRFVSIAAAMVLTQLLAAMGLLSGVAIPSCVASDQCAASHFCEHGSQRCSLCGDTVPLPVQVNADGSTLNHVPDLNFAGFNRTMVQEVCSVPADRIGLNSIGVSFNFPKASVQEWCETCVHPIDLRVEAVDAKQFIYDRNLGAMVALDWFALLFSSICVAFKLAGERNDIELCRLAAVHGRDELARGWRTMLGAIGFVRRWIFLPLVMVSMVTMVLYRGSDAMSVCLNAIGVIFLCDIDSKSICSFSLVRSKICLLFDEFRLLRSDHTYFLDFSPLTIAPSSR